MPAGITGYDRRVHRHQFNSLFLLTVRELQRTGFVWLVFGTMLAAFAVAEFAASLALTESDACRQVVYAATVRLVLVFGVALAAIANCVRDVQDQVLELVLSRPVARPLWYCARFAAYAAAAASAALVASLPLLALGVEVARVSLWGLSFACELLVVLAVAQAAAISLGAIPAAFGTLGAFYLLSRAVQAIVLLSRESLLDTGSAVHRMVAGTVTALAYVLPDFARFTASDWLIGTDVPAGEVGFVATQTAIYAALWLAVGLVDLQRRDYR
jgi:hypothetical protein